ncbi:MAG: hypothetical protein IPM47_16030 [Sphingobacteriales bacterium]|nr:MAG: hypothetical protein IPM47_16030 [Sphingobacteriales bacterium]
MHSFETIMSAIEKQFNRISPTAEISLFGVIKLSLDGFLKVDNPTTKAEAMAVIAAFHFYRHRMDTTAYNFFANNMRKSIYSYSGLRDWRLSQLAVPEVLDSTASALRSSSLVGVWSKMESYRSGDFSFKSFGNLTLQSNGVYIKSNRSYTSDTYKYSDGSFKGSSSGSFGGDEILGLWGNSFDDFYLCDPNERTYFDYDCKLNQGVTLILTQSNGNEQIWSKIR